MRDRLEYPSVCCWQGCEAPSRLRPKILIWAKCTPERKRTPHNCLPCDLGIALCSEHARGRTPDEFLSDDGRAKIAAAVDGLNRAEPDFDGAVLQWITLTELN